MKDKILKQYKDGFSSSPVELTSAEIDFIIKNDCNCNNCGRSIFETEDFPNILIEDDELLCEYCYDDKYREICPICEEYYDTREESSKHFIINEELSKETGLPAGIYEILKRPFFFGNILTGFESFFEDSIKIVTRIDINKYKEIECGSQYCEVYADFICSGCVEKFTRKERYIDINGRPCILYKRYEDTLFFDYSPVQLKNARIKLIHERINCRGIIQTANWKDSSLLKSKEKRL